MSQLIVTARHVQAAHMCLKPGAQKFFKQHNLDFRSFIKNGIDAELLIATGDALALQVVEVARKELGKSNGR